MELNEEDLIFNNEQLALIKDVSSDIYDEMGSVPTKLITKNFVYELYLALLISIPLSNIFEYISKIEEKDPQKELMDLYDDIQNTPLPSKKSTNLKRKITSKYEYYEKIFKLRSKIQNYEFNYHNLGASTANFIQARERLRIEYKHIQKNPIGTICCIGCNTKWLQKDNDFCPVCEKENDINMFATLANFFNIVGDMTQFYQALHPETHEFLLDHWTQIHTLFKKKNKEKNTRLMNKLKAKYGMPQYNKIIKVEGGDWRLEKDIIEFNRKYKLAIVPGTLELDFRTAHNGSLPEFISDINSIRFPFAEKIYFPSRKIDFNNFKPNMPALEEIYAQDCSIKFVDLDPENFLNVRRIDLEGNDIESVDDIKCLKKFKSLKLINLRGNPIERTNAIYDAEEELDPIEIRYDVRKKYLCKAKIADETDSDVKKIMEQNIDYDVSESSISSIPNQQKLKKREMRFPSFDDKSSK